MIYFISSYPERGLTHGKKTVGVASSTKNIILNLLRKKPQLKIKIFAEIFDHQEKYTEANIEVERTWKRNDLSSIIKTFRQIPKHSTLVVPIEFYMFGTTSEMICALLIMMGLRLLNNVKIILIVHQVVENFDNLNESFISNNLKTIFVKIYYFLIKIASNKIVIFEEYFKKVIGGKKTIFIPHAVEDGLRLSFVKQSKELTLLYFGFISPYKGIDDLINKYDKKCGKLIIAGGKNPNHTNNYEYELFYKKMNTYAKTKNIQITGFVAEKDMEKYFTEADIVIFPYTNFFSSSGPLSLAFTHEKTVILSKPMIKYFISPDFKLAAEKVGLKPEDFVFDFKNENSNLTEKIDFIINNRNKFVAFAKLIKEFRSWENVTNQYYEIIK